MREEVPSRSVVTSTKASRIITAPTIDTIWSAGITDESIDESGAGGDDLRWRPSSAEGSAREESRREGTGARSGAQPVESAAGASVQAALRSTVNEAWLGFT